MKMGIWLRKAVLFAAVLGLWGLFQKLLKHLPANLFAEQIFRSCQIWKNLVQNIMKTIFQKMP